MADKYQYRVTIGDRVGSVVDVVPPGQWEQIAEASEERGYVAKMERRFVTDASILPCLSDATGWMKIGKIVVSPWETVAAFNS